MLKEDFLDVLNGTINLKLQNKWVSVANDISIKEDIGLIFEEDFGRAIQAIYIRPRAENWNKVPDPIDEFWDKYNNQYRSEIINIIKAWATESGVSGIKYTPELDINNKDKNHGQNWADVFRFYKLNKNNSSGKRRPFSKLSKMIEEYLDEEVQKERETT